MTIARTLIQELLSDIDRADPNRIGIDGIYGVGKSTLAKSTAKHSGLPLIAVDEFVEKNKGGYAPYVDYGELRSAASKGQYIIDGVCLLDVLKAADLAIDVLIYVKRTHLGLWADEDSLGLEQDLERFLEKERYVAAEFAGLSEPEPDLGLSEEIIRYHHIYRPHEEADFTFDRNDS